jgi:hypothetical protein
MRRRSFSCGLVAAWLTGCGSHMGNQRPFDILDSQSTALTRSFDADHGKVRVLMLVSPT